MIKIPKDGINNVVPLVPATVSFAFTRNTSISTSTTLNLNTRTSFIEVHALDGNVYLRWGSTAVTNSNAHEFIQAGQTRHFFVPEENESTGALYTTLRLIDDGDSAKVIVIEK